MADDENSPRIKQKSPRDPILRRSDAAAPITAAAINAAKAKVASRLSANASEARRKKTQKRGEGQNSTDQNRFHYLGGSLNCQFFVQL